MHTHLLSKSLYIDFLRHPALLWLKIHNKTKLPSITESTQDIFDAGNEFEFYVEQLFNNAIKVGFSMTEYGSYKTMPSRTLEAVNSSADYILQGRLVANNLTNIFDVLRRVKNTSDIKTQELEVKVNEFDLIEIKSSSSVKEEHYYDLAFQKHALKQAGLNIRNTSVIHLNSEYTRKGEIDVNELVIEVDVSEEVNALEQITIEQIARAFEVIESVEQPSFSPRFVNQLQIPNTKWKDQWMEIFRHLNPDLDKTSIYNLCRLSTEQVGEFEDMGFTDIEDIPEDLQGLHEKQVNQIITTKTGNRIINTPAIKDFINSFHYPLYFFDYETLSNIVPLFDGMQPYKDYPFQYSLHILESPIGFVDGEYNLIHKEYIHTENSNPVPKLLDQLIIDVGDTGSIISWNASYEKTCNSRMAKAYPEYADFLEDLNERMVDLMIPFANQWFVDKNFYGSASVKAVLPVLCPELSYKELEVSDGLTARRVWTNTFLKSANIWESDEILKNLSDYCKLDTYAMVKICQILEAHINNTE